MTSVPLPKLHAAPHASVQCNVVAPPLLTPIVLIPPTELNSTTRNDPQLAAKNTNITNLLEKGETPSTFTPANLTPTSVASQLAPLPPVALSVASPKHRPVPSSSHVVYPPLQTVQNYRVQPHRRNDQEKFQGIGTLPQQNQQPKSTHHNHRESIQHPHQPQPQPQSQPQPISQQKSKENSKTSPSPNQLQQESNDKLSTPLVTVSTIINSMSMSTSSNAYIYHVITEMRSVPLRDALRDWSIPTYGTKDALVSRAYMYVLDKLSLDNTENIVNHEQSKEEKLQNFVKFMASSKLKKDYELFCSSMKSALTKWPVPPTTEQMNEMIESTKQKNRDSGKTCRENSKIFKNISLKKRGRGKRAARMIVNEREIDRESRFVGRETGVKKKKENGKMVVQRQRNQDPKGEEEENASKETPQKEDMAFVHSNGGLYEVVDDVVSHQSMVHECSRPDNNVVGDSGYDVDSANMKSNNYGDRADICSDDPDVIDNMGTEHVSSRQSVRSVLNGVTKHYNSSANSDTKLGKQRKDEVHKRESKTGKQRRSAGKTIVEYSDRDILIKMASDSEYEDLVKHKPSGVRAGKRIIEGSERGSFRRRESHNETEDVVKVKRGGARHQKKIMTRAEKRLKAVENAANAVGAAAEAEEGMGLGECRAGLDVEEFLAGDLQAVVIEAGREVGHCQQDEDEELVDGAEKMNEENDDEYVMCRGDDSVPDEVAVIRESIRRQQEHDLEEDHLRTLAEGHASPHSEMKSSVDVDMVVPAVQKLVPSRAGGESDEDDESFDFGGAVCENDDDDDDVDDVNCDDGDIYADDVDDDVDDNLSIVEGVDHKLNQRSNTYDYGVDRQHQLDYGGQDGEDLQLDDDDEDDYSDDGETGVMDQLSAFARLILILRDDSSIQETFLRHSIPSSPSSSATNNLGKYKGHGRERIGSHGQVKFDVNSGGIAAMESEERILWETKVKPKFNNLSFKPVEDFSDVMIGVHPELRPRKRLHGLELRQLVHEVRQNFAICFAKFFDATWTMGIGVDRFREIVRSDQINGESGHESKEEMEEKEEGKTKRLTKVRRRKGRRKRKGYMGENKMSDVGRRCLVLFSALKCGTDQAYLHAKLRSFFTKDCRYSGITGDLVSRLGDTGKGGEIEREEYKRERQRKADDKQQYRSDLRYECDQQHELEKQCDIDKQRELKLEQIAAEREEKLEDIVEDRVEQESVQQEKNQDMENNRDPRVECMLLQAEIEKEKELDKVWELEQEKLAFEGEQEEGRTFERERKLQRNSEQDREFQRGNQMEMENVHMVEDRTVLDTSVAPRAVIMDRWRKAESSRTGSLSGSITGLAAEAGVGSTRPIKEIMKMKFKGYGNVSVNRSSSQSGSASSSVYGRVEVEGQITKEANFEKRPSENRNRDQEQQVLEDSPERPGEHQQGHQQGHQQKVRQKQGYEEEQQQGHQQEVISLVSRQEQNQKEQQQRRQQDIRREQKPEEEEHGNQRVLKKKRLCEEKEFRHRQVLRPEQQLEAEKHGYEHMLGPKQRHEADQQHQQEHTDQRQQKENKKVQVASRACGRRGHIDVSGSNSGGSLKQGEVDDGKNGGNINVDMNQTIDVEMNEGGNGGSETAKRTILVNRSMMEELVAAVAGSDQVKRRKRKRGDADEGESEGDMEENERKRERKETEERRRSSKRMGLLSEIAHVQKIIGEMEACGRNENERLMGTLKRHADLLETELQKLLDEGV